MGLFEAVCRTYTALQAMLPIRPGGAVITAATLIKDIDGYTGYLNSDYIQLGGKDTNGMDVSDGTFTLSDATTVGDLLTKIQSLFRRCDRLRYRHRKADDCGQHLRDESTGDADRH